MSFIIFSPTFKKCRHKTAAFLFYNKLQIYFCKIKTPQNITSCKTLVFAMLKRLLPFTFSIYHLPFTPCNMSFYQPPQ